MAKLAHSLTATESSQQHFSVYHPSKNDSSRAATVLGHGSGGSRCESRPPSAQSSRAHIIEIRRAGGWLRSLTTSTTWVDGITSTAGTSSARGGSSGGVTIGDGSVWLTPAKKSTLGPSRCGQNASAVTTVSDGDSPADVGTTRSGEGIPFGTCRVADPFTSDRSRGGESSTLSRMTRLSLTAVTTQVRARYSSRARRNDRNHARSKLSVHCAPSLSLCLHRKFTYLIETSRGKLLAQPTHISNHDSAPVAAAHSRRGRCGPHVAKQDATPMSSDHGTAGARTAKIQGYARSSHEKSIAPTRRAALFHARIASTIPGSVQNREDSLVHRAGTIQ